MLVLDVHWVKSLVAGLTQAAVAISTAITQQHTSVVETKYGSGMKPI